MLSPVRAGAARAYARTPARPGTSAYVTPVAVWCLLLAGCLVAGFALDAYGMLRIGSVPPFHGSLRVLTWQLLPAVAYAALAVAVLPRWCRTLRWLPLLLVVWGGSAAWACLLAASDGVGAIAAPLTGPDEYLGIAAGIGPHPVAWLHGFAGAVDTYPTHVAGHPPLPVLVFWALRAVGLPGPGWAAALCVLLGASAGAAVLVTVRRVLDESRARTLAPYLLLAPYVLTVATSADAMFLGVTAWGVALLAVAAGRGSIALGLASGLLLGAMPYLNYGLLPLGAVAVAVVLLSRRSPYVLGGAVLGGALVTAAFTAGGFWWPDGVVATHARWAVGTGSHRPYAYMLVANLALFAVITGPATAAGLPRVRERRTVVLLGAALLAVAVTDLSGVTRGEVERIWLPYAPWAMLATMGVPGGSRGWLAAQAATAVAAQGLVALLW